MILNDCMIRVNDFSLAKGTSDVYFGEADRFGENQFYSIRVKSN